MNGPRHLYLHAPFCRTKCPYCDYPVAVDGPPDLGGWIQALRTELELRGERDGVDLGGVTTLHVGGGTPSTLGAGAMREVRALLGERRVAHLSEWSVEVNPEDVEDRLLATWRAAGVDRVSLGVQSLRPEALRWLGRRHRAAEATSAAERVARAGFRTWGVDLLFGLPDEVDPDPMVSLGAIIDLGAPHVSLYELVAEEDTPLGQRVAAGEARLSDDDRRAEQFVSLGSRLEAAGYERYELTGFARPGHRSRHLDGVLETGSWLGVGPGAHTALNGLRIWNLPDWGVYLTSIAQGALPEASRSHLNDREARTEWIERRLRLAAGVPLDLLSGPEAELVQRWLREGWAAPDPFRVRLTAQGWLRLDRLARELARAG
jgi:oxygen-independent coproporphyrinogen-3 oxidase